MTVPPASAAGPRHPPDPEIAALLRAAAEFVAGDSRLARRLGIDPGLLGQLIADLPPPPDPLLVRAARLVLAGRSPAAPLAADPLSDRERAAAP